MRYRHLGNSGLEVSETGLGANSFGEPGRRDYAESKSIIYAAIDHGINFIDTSNVYAQGVSEEYIGRALEGRRHEMLIGNEVWVEARAWAKPVRGRTQVRDGCGGG